MTGRQAASPPHLLSDLSKAHRLSGSAGEVFSSAASFLPLLRRHLGISFAYLLLPDEARASIVLLGGRLGRTAATRRYPEAEASGLAPLLTARKRVAWAAPDLPPDLRRRGERGVVVPLPRGGGGRAKLLIRDTDVSRIEGPGAQALLSHLAVAIANADAYRQALDLSFRDELTGVYNYRFLMEALDREAKRAQRFEHVFSLIMLDLDNLKAYNDRHGHLRGSEVIRTVGGVIVTCLRRVDLAAKYGGDEFVIILPRTDKRGAHKVAERIRTRIARHPFPGGGGAGAITASFGVASYPEDAKSPRVLLRKADRALYRAKAKGRNTVAE